MQAFSLIPEGSSILADSISSVPSEVLPVSALSPCPPHLIPPSLTQPAPLRLTASPASSHSGGFWQADEQEGGVPPLPKSYYLKYPRPDSILIGRLICILPL